MSISTADPARAALVNEAAIAQYLDMLFGPHDWPEGTGIGLRGLGEKGTPAEGKFQENIFVPAGTPEIMLAAVIKTVRRWNEHGHGAFIIPKIVRPEVDDRQRYHFPDASIVAATALPLDFDTGDTVAKLMAARAELGEPSMVVESGGRTAEGKPKLHVYWSFTEAVEDMARVSAMCNTAALRYGADASFKRIAQVIRIPGTLHGKGGGMVPVKIVHQGGGPYEFGDLADAIGPPPVEPGVGGGLRFTPQSGNMAGGGDDLGTTLSSEVLEGGEDRTRWGEFNRVAGAFIRQAREGDIDLATAKDLTLGWMAAKMRPPWPEERFEREWMGLLHADARNHGPIVGPQATGTVPAVVPQGAADPFRHLTVEGILERAGKNWIAGGDIPVRRWIVPGLVAAGKPQLFVAEGGAGKTMLMLDLCLKVAGGSSDPWMGCTVNAAERGMTIFVTAEDDWEEVKIRARTMFSEEQIKAAGDNFIVMPLVNDGGTFPLVQSRRVKHGNEVVEEHGPSEQWNRMMASLNEIAKTRKIALVVLDTFNATMHGEENSATIVQEYFRQAARVCGELGAALIVTHHVRKRGKDPIASRDDMRDAVRGSSALLGSVRQAIGIWQAVDWDRRMKAMGEQPKPGMLYHAAVVKTNNAEALQTTLTMLRDERTGLLHDVTGRDVVRRTPDRDTLRRAWLIAAVARAAAAGRPYQITGKIHGIAATGKGAIGRKAELPEVLKTMGAKSLIAMANRLVEEGALAQAAIIGSGTTGSVWLDIPTGSIAQGNPPPDADPSFPKMEGAWVPDWSGWEYDITRGAVGNWQ